MSKKKSMPLIGKLALTLAPAFFVLSTLGQQLARSLEFNIPEADVGQLIILIGRGYKDYCRISREEKLIALIPSQNWGAEIKTISKTPTLYWYVPENNAEIAEIGILDEEGNELYWIEFTPPSKPGIINYEIPASAGLEEGKPYRLLMALVCDPEDRATDVFVWGNILVVAKPVGLEEDLAAAKNPLEEASAYAKAQIWHDTLSSLAEVAEQYPEEWTELLESVGLPEEIATAEMLDCCKAEKVFFDLD